MLTDEGMIELSAGRDGSRSVANTGDRPIQVGSHYHFFETNTALAFDRAPSSRLSPQHPQRHRRALRAGTRTHRDARALRWRPQDLSSAAR